jgi:chemotaxis protein methyltransferase CheR
VLDRLLDEVTVQETSFLRDEGQLAGIDWEGLHAAGVAAGHGSIRVWSAGCATGEEAYSLALLACEAFESRVPPVEILGTDLSSAAIARAEAGIYRVRRARNVSEGLFDRYLEHDEAAGTVSVRPALRRLVRFARHNLVRDPAPPAGEEPFDLILCRNVLIYFDPVAAEEVATRLAGALRPGGRLVLGAADQLGRSPRAAAAPPEPHAAPPRSPESLLADAIADADADRPADALAAVAALLARDPLNAAGHFLRGLVLLPDDPAGAAESLRRALLSDPRFGLAAFQLGRAYDALGDGPAARAAYEKALDALDPDDARYDGLLRQVDLGDVATAIRARIQVLR